MKQSLSKKTLASMIRVDHAGEYGAKRIYEGQLALLRRSPSYETVRTMKEQEQHHLTTFEELMVRRRVRPTALMPLWHIGGWILGATTAALGDKAAMACTVAVESVIAEHYQQQETALDDAEPKLRATMQQFRLEEMEHHDTALDYGARQAPLYRGLYHGIRGITKTAIALSKRI